MNANMPIRAKGHKKTVKTHSEKTELTQAQVAIEAFFEIADLWQLKDKESMTLLGISNSTFYDWQGGKFPARLAPEKLERISYILGIYKALQILFTSKDRADAWVKRANNAPLFGGCSALDYMMKGNVSDLYNVRRFLDAQLGW